MVPSLATFHEFVALSLMFQNTLLFSFLAPHPPHALHYYVPRRTLKGHNGVPGSKLALVVGNVSSDGNSKKLSATEGDIVLAQEGDARGWVHVQRIPHSTLLSHMGLSAF